MSNSSNDAPLPDFEASMEKLEALVRQLEDGDLKMDEALSAFEQGIRLSRQCQQALQQAEQKVQALVERNGDLQEVPFSSEDEGA